MSVAVAADHAQAGAARRGGARNEAGAECQCAAAASGENDLVDAEAGNAQPGDRVGVRPEPGPVRRASATGTLPGVKQKDLGELGLGGHVGAVPPEDRAERQRQQGAGDDRLARQDQSSSRPSNASTSPASN